MPTQINQTDDPVSRITTLRVDGEMLGEDATVLEKIATGLRDETGNDIVIDLADLDFLDSEAAPILKGLAEREGFAIEGVEIFLQSAVNMAERVEADLT
jgi:anti-anti-sigma regulatory factor